MKLRNLIIASISLVGFVSCDKSENVGTTLPEDNIIRVSADVNDPVTRAGAETTNLTEFGMFVTPQITSNYTYANVKANKGENNIWSSSETMLWKNESATVDIVTYAPYNSTFTNLSAEYNISVMADQSTTENVIASDFLYAKSAVTPNDPITSNDIHYDEEKVMVTLGHKLSKLFLTIELASEFNDILYGTTVDPISSVSINGTNTATIITLVDGNTTALSDVKAITPYDESYTKPAAQAGIATAKYEAIIIPQTIASGGLSIDIVINNVTYTWTSSSSLTFVGGNSHSLTLTVGDDIINVSAISVGDWTGGTGGNIITD